MLGNMVGNIHVNKLGNMLSKMLDDKLGKMLLQAKKRDFID